MEDTGMIFAEKTALRGPRENPRITPGTYSRVAAGEMPGAVFFLPSIYEHTSRSSRQGGTASSRNRAGMMLGESSFLIPVTPIPAPFPRVIEGHCRKRLSLQDCLRDEAGKFYSLRNAPRMLPGKPLRESPFPIPKPTPLINPGSLPGGGRMGFPADGPAQIHV